ncbi:GIY-YIG nuclease family protein [Novosphingobium sp.]|uniref:GIY-YIG nuclease family protein n=1 Tax=Novosphingobium sp. TaxID=1874826 RepID=UPI00286A293C|nr:hypothetical protein [Novosphingobium sp.]
MEGWLQFENAVAVRKVEAHLPHEPGKYAFFVENVSRLPEQFMREATTRPIPRLLYIGKADVSLVQRVWLEECQHRSPGTFFRSVGAMLGYKSPKGGRNYEFSPGDKMRVIEWIADNLRVTWHAEVLKQSHRIGEQALINQFLPLLNLQGNPRKFSELSRLRAACRSGNGT